MLFKVVSLNNFCGKRMFKVSVLGFRSYNFLFFNLRDVGCVSVRLLYIRVLLFLLIFLLNGGMFFNCFLLYVGINVL